jgi:hypothetical protein
MNIRLDFGFSYWLFIWYILYQLKFTLYNPKIGLLLALLENVITLLAMVYYKNKLLYIIVFCLLNTFIKVIPIWTLWNTAYKWSDFYAAIALFLVFSIWLSIHNLNFIKLEIDMFSEIKKGNPSGPATYYAEKYL